MTTSEDVEWRPVVGYEDKYEVSTVGTVRSAISGKELAQWANNCGYLLTTLTAKGEGTNYLIHRLVAQAFLPNPENKPTVDHLNHRRDDNRVENLRWATQREQIDEITRRRMSVAQKQAWAIRKLIRQGYE